LGEERCKQIELVSADMAGWIATPIAERCPQAERCVDPFHVVQVRHEALPVRAGCETPPPGCRGSPAKLRTA
jgi:transposase